MEKELFVSGTNRITFDENHCYFEINGTKPRKYTLDRDLRAMEAIEEHIKRWGVFRVTGDSHGTGEHGSLRAVVYQAYHPYGKEICFGMSQKSKSVYLCDGNPYNLTSSNLYVIGDEVPCNQNRRIWHDDCRIWIKLTAQDLVFFTDYTSDLYSLLCDTRLASWQLMAEGNKAEPPRVEGWERKRKTRILLKAEPKSYVSDKSRYLACNIERCSITVGFHVLIWLYHTGKLRKDDLEGSIKEGMADLAENELEIDHLRNNTQNNCIHNLSAMKSAENHLKCAKIVRISLPFFFVPVRVGNRFRVLCGKVNGEDVNTKGIICDGIGEFLNCLDQFLSLANDSGEMLTKPKNRKTTNCLSQMLMDDGQEYHGSQYNPIEWLLRADESEFEHWNRDLSWLQT